MTNTKQDAERQQELIRRWQDHDEFLTVSEMAELLNALVDERQARAAQEPRPQVDGTMYWNGVGTRTSCEEPRPAGGELRPIASGMLDYWLRDYVQFRPNWNDEIMKFLAAFAASERGQEWQQLLRAVGKVLETSEEFRLDHAELLDAYHACLPAPSAEKGR